MKRDDALEKTLYRHLGLFGMPSANQLDASSGRIRERLWADVGPVLSDPPRAGSDRPTHRTQSQYGYMWRAGVSMAAAVILLVVIVSTSRRLGADALATVDAADGSLQSLSGNPRQLHPGDAIKATTVIRSNGAAGAVLALKDGSHVEMRSQSELSLERADDGMKIRLRTGSIIVNAATQPTGHLYVQTNDVTVAVVGTIFLVNAEKDGSRVAVIEGEVRVHEGTTDTKLRPGEQVSTSRAVAARPVAEEIAWSRQADAHLAILAAFSRGMAQTVGPLSPLANAADSSQATAAAPRQEFEEASIRPCDPDKLPTPEGARGGGANSFQMTPGRTHALCLTLATIIRHAYGYGPAGLDFDRNARGRGRGMGLNEVAGLGVEDGVRVRGGPDWVRSERYTIEAVAEDAADAETMSGPMMRALLEKRFQLKAHVEAEQVAAFSLTVARGGLKIKPVASGACEPLPARPGSPLLNGQPMNVLTPPRSFSDVRRGGKPSCGLWNQRNGPNMVLVGGEVPLSVITGLLGFQLGGVRVVDNTGVTEKFNFILEFVLDENTPGLRGGGLRVAQGGPSDVPRAATVFTALEEQLGLRLEPSKAPREFIVIDHVERPSPN